MTHDNPYDTGLCRNEANFVALSPLTFLARSAYVYPGRTAVIHGDRKYSWREAYARCRRLASALAGIGIGVGDTAAVMLPNVPAMFEAHFGVTMTGAVLNSLNTRLDAQMPAISLDQTEAESFVPVVASIPLSDNTVSG